MKNLTISECIVLFVVATQENHPADYTCQTENNLSDNQRCISFLPRSVPFWYPKYQSDYYSLQCNVLSNETKADKFSCECAYLPNGSTYLCNDNTVRNMRYDQNLEIFGQINFTCRENITRQLQHDANSQSTIISPQLGLNSVHQSCCNIPSAYNGRHSIDESSRKITLPNEVNHLDAKVWNKVYYSKNQNNHSDDGDRKCILQMNITDKKDNITKHNSMNTSVCSNIDTFGKIFGLHIKVPNYTYIDTSDSSSASSDSSISNNHPLDSCENYFDHNSNISLDHTLSDSDSDSDSDYSNDLSFQEKPQEENMQRFIPNQNCIDDIAYLEPAFNNSLDNTDINTQISNKVSLDEDCFNYSNNVNFNDVHQKDIATKVYNEDDSDDGNNFNLPFSNRTFKKIYTRTNKKKQKQKYKMGNTMINITAPYYHYLISLTNENIQQPIFKNFYYIDKKNVRNNTSSSFVVTVAIDDDTNTRINVSLPLRIKFFVSEINENVTTVITDNSKIKTEKLDGIKDRCSVKGNYKMDNICVNFDVGSDTSANFTVKKYSITDEGGTKRNARNEAIEMKIPQLNFTLQKNPTSDCENDTKTFINMTYHGINSESIKMIDSDILSDSKVIIQDIVNRKDVPLLKNNDDIGISSIYDNLESNTFDKMTIVESKAIVPKHSWTQNDFETEQIRIIDKYNTNKTDQKTNAHDNSVVFQKNGQPYSLNIHSREKTENSKAISNMIDPVISDIDTNSECISLMKYQRTQTHSRLFRLLNDDCPKIASSSLKDYFNLPLKKSTFNCDDSYCANYSSNLISSEYSSAQTGQQKFLDMTTNEDITKSINNQYEINNESMNQSQQIIYQNNCRSWKNSKLLGSHNIVPSLAFKILDKKLPFWAYKVNVLCPRIKSVKDVPQTLLTRQSTMQSTSSGTTDY